MTNNKIGQKQSLINEIKSTLGDSFDPSTPARLQITHDQLLQIRKNIVNGIIDGKIAYNKDLTDTKAIEKYVPSMMSNHFRRALQLNGNVPCTPSGKPKVDTQLSELNKLLKQYDVGSPEYTGVVDAIKEREFELAVKKQKSTRQKKHKDGIDVSIVTGDVAKIVSDFRESISETSNA